MNRPCSGRPLPMNSHRSRECTRPRPGRPSRRLPSQRCTRNQKNPACWRTAHFRRMSMCQRRTRQRRNRSCRRPPIRHRTHIHTSRLCSRTRRYRRSRPCRQDTRSGPDRSCRRLPILSDRRTKTNRAYWCKSPRRRNRPLRQYIRRCRRIRRRYRCSRRCTDRNTRHRYWHRLRFQRSHRHWSRIRQCRRMHPYPTHSPGRTRSPLACHCHRTRRATQRQAGPTCQAWRRISPIPGFPLPFQTQTCSYSSVDLVFNMSIGYACRP